MSQFDVEPAQLPVPSSLQVSSCVDATASLLPLFVAPSIASIDAHSAANPFGVSRKPARFCVAAISLPVGGLLDVALVSQCGAQNALYSGLLFESLSVILLSLRSAISKMSKIAPGVPPFGHTALLPT